LPPPIPGMYSKVRGVEVTAAMESKDQIENVRINIKRNLPIFEDMPEYNKIKGRNKKIAIVGGGPSLKKHIDELREFRTIISCGSVHDYLISVGVIPTYATNCDPDALCKEYFTKPDSEVKYLISTNSHPDLFEALKGQQLITWHCHSGEQQEELIKLEAERGKAYNGVGGGCTVGLRSICLALNMGYCNQHLFGFDSCMADAEGKEHHAYGWAKPEIEEGYISQVHKIRLGGTDGPETKEYYVAGYQLAQLENYKHFYCAHRAYFIPTFHGEGAMSAFHALIEQDIDKQLAKGVI